ncbi:MAG: impB/mucB/samB family protein [Pseudomonadota bacterium]
MNYAAADGLRYLFIDFNAFFAGVEQHDDPSIMGKPVIVIPMESEHTSAIAASYEARPFGISRMTKVSEARAACPDIVIRPARHDRYAQVHRELMAEIERHLPLDKVYSIDEAAFRLSPSEREAPAALATARRVMEGIRTNVGPALRASVGVAQTRLLAKLAAESKKPDGFTALEPADLPGKLVGMDITDIPGVGAGVAARLAKAGVTDFSGLWALSPKQARAIWGSVQGERFWYGLHGYEVDEPETKKSMIGHSRVLTKGYEAPDEARIVARALLLKAASRLRHYNMYAQTLSLSVKVRPEGRWQGAASFPPSQDSYRFLDHLHVLWDRFLSDYKFETGRPRLAGVTTYLHGLAKDGDPAVRQGDLFAEPVLDEKSEKRARLWAAIDRINADPDRKFARLAGAPGATAKGPAPRRHVTLARQQGLDLNYLGAKIAFSRVPEEAEFLY